jgi:hypothetical protein
MNEAVFRLDASPAIAGKTSRQPDPGWGTVDPVSGCAVAVTSPISGPT